MKTKISTLLLCIFLTLSASSQTFYDAGFVYRVIGDGQAAVEGYSGASESVIIPNVAAYERQSLRVTLVGFNAFAGSKIRSVTITRNITQIGANAFQGCRDLVRVVIEGDALRSIGYEAFEGCSNLNSISIPATVRTISARAFANCPAAKSIAGYNDQTGVSRKQEATAWKDYGYSDGYFYLNDMRFKKISGFRMALDATKAGLSNVVVPKTIKDSDGKTFIVTSIDSCDIATQAISIPGTIATINGRIFTGNPNLKQISFDSEIVQPITIKNMGSFENYKALRNLKISAPKGKLDEYKVAISAFRHMNYEPAKEEGDYTYAKIVGRNECAILSYRGKGGKVSIPSSIAGLQVVTIEDNAFNFDSRLCTVGYDMSEQDQKLLQVDIPEGVRHLADDVFNNQTQLQVVSLPSTLTSIGDRTFNKCIKLQSIKFPNGLIRVGQMAFANCEALKELVLPDALATIGDNAFAYCRSVKTLRLPMSLTAIGDGWFAHCEKLESLDLPQNLVSIGLNSFSDCYKLSAVKLPVSVKYIGHPTTNLFDEQLSYFGSFSNCKNLKSVDLGSAVEYVGEDAFAGCEKLQQISLPSTLTYLGTRAFNGCRSLKEIVIPKYITNIGGSTKFGTFVGCTSLQKVIFNCDNLESIAAYSFAGCSSLYDVALPSSLKWIDEAAFQGCKSMQIVTIPKQVHALGYKAFADCTGLKKLIVSDGVARLSFYDDEREYSRGGSAFAGCTSLTEISLPNSLTIIENSMFEGCDKLEQVVIPGNVAEIEVDAFRSCKRLTEVKVYTSEVIIDNETKDNIFADCPMLKTISTPTGNINL